MYIEQYQSDKFFEELDRQRIYVNDLADDDGTSLLIVSEGCGPYRALYAKDSKVLFEAETSRYN